MEFKGYFRHAELSEASYADFEGLTKTEEFKTALEAEGFSPTQAADFVTHWQVVDHQPNTLVSGFSATLFQRLDGTGDPLPEFSLGIRGTEFDLFNPTDTDLRDVIVDAGLAVGLAPQKSDLEAYYTYLITRGKLTATQTLRVTGHSLGGFLTQLFAADHPHVVGHAFTYNAPGIGGAIAEVLGKFGILAEEVPASIIDNLYGQAGGEIASGLGTMLGAAIPVFIEQPHVYSSSFGHGIGQVVDSLAVYQALGALDTTKTIDSLAELFSAASSHPGQTLETLTNALGELLGTGNPITTSDVREDLYQRIHAIHQTLYVNPDAPAPDLKPQYQGLHLVPLVDQTAAELVALAHAGIATRYALVHGNPFAVTGLDYSVHNANHALDLYDPATDLGMTETYLTDRAQYLALKDRLFIKDTTIE